MPELDGKSGTYVVNGTTEGKRVEVEGPYYPISRVSLTKSNVTNAARVKDYKSFSNGTGCEIQMFGTYQATSAPANAYAFSNGKLYHITKDTPIKGFRCWIEDKHQMGTASEAPRHQLGT